MPEIKTKDEDETKSKLYTTKNTPIFLRMLEYCDKVSL